MLNNWLLEIGFVNAIGAVLHQTSDAHFVCLVLDILIDFSAIPDYNGHVVKMQDAPRQLYELNIVTRVVELLSRFWDRLDNQLLFSIFQFLSNVSDHLHEAAQKILGVTLKVMRQYQDFMLDPKGQLDVEVLESVGWLLNHLVLKYDVVKSSETAQDLICVTIGLLVRFDHIPCAPSSSGDQDPELAKIAINIQNYGIRTLGNLIEKEGCAVDGALEIIKYEEWCYLQQHNRASMIGSGDPNNVQFGQFSMPLIESVNQILNKNQTNQELCSHALNLLSILLEHSDEDKSFMHYICM